MKRRPITIRTASRAHCLQLAHDGSAAVARRSGEQPVRVWSACALTCEARWQRRKYRIVE